VPRGNSDQSYQAAAARSGCFQFQGNRSANASASMASSGQIQLSGLIDTGPATIAAT